MLSVYRGRLAIGIRLVFVRIQDLDLIEAHQKNTAVAAFLAFPFRRYGLRKFHVQLAVAECLPRVDVAGFRNRLKVAVLHFPLRGASVLVRPFGKIFSVEEHHGIGRRTPRRILSAGRPGLNHGWQRAVGIVNFPLRIHLRATERHSAKQEKHHRYEDFFHGSDLAADAVKFYRKCKSGRPTGARSLFLMGTVDCQLSTVNCSSTQPPLSSPSELSTVNCRLSTFSATRPRLRECASRKTIGKR